MNYELVQWLILGALPAALAIFGIFSPYIIGERWERIIVEKLTYTPDKNGNLKYIIIYRYNNGKWLHKKSTSERIYKSVTVGKKYKALIRRTKTLMLKHPSEYTI